jgi:hypothetical protein
VSVDRPKRRRMKVSRLMDEDLLDEETRQLQLALRNSRQEIQKTTVPVPDAPTYRPTLEEFKDPLEYITRSSFTGSAYLTTLASAKKPKNMEFVRLFHHLDGIHQMC